MLDVLENNLPDAAVAFAATEREKDVLIGRVRYLRAGLVPMAARGKQVSDDDTLPDVRIDLEVYGVGASKPAAYTVYDGVLAGGNARTPFAELALTTSVEVAFLSIRMEAVAVDACTPASYRHMDVHLWVEASTSTDGPWIRLYDNNCAITPNWTTLDTPFSGRPFVPLPIERHLDVRCYFVREAVPYHEGSLGGTGGGEPWRIVLVGERYALQDAIGVLWRDVLKRRDARPTVRSRRENTEAVAGARSAALKTLAQNVRRYFKFAWRYEPSEWFITRIVGWRAVAEARHALMPPDAVNPSTYDDLDALQSPMSTIAGSPRSPSASPKSRRKKPAFPGSSNGDGTSNSPQKKTRGKQRKSSIRPTSTRSASPTQDSPPLLDVTAAAECSARPSIEDIAAAAKAKLVEAVVGGAPPLDKNCGHRLSAVVDKVLALDERGLEPRSCRDEPIVVRNVPVFRPLGRGNSVFGEQVRVSDAKRQLRARKICRPTHAEAVAMSPQKAAFVVSLATVRAREGRRVVADAERCRRQLVEDDPTRRSTHDDAAAAKTKEDCEVEAALQLEGMIQCWWARLQRQGEGKKRKKAATGGGGDAASPCDAKPPGAVATVGTKATLKLCTRAMASVLSIPNSIALEVADEATWLARKQQRKGSKSSAGHSLNGTSTFGRSFANTMNTTQQTAATSRRGSRSASITDGGATGTNAAAAAAAAVAAVNEAPAAVTAVTVSPPPDAGDPRPLAGTAGAAPLSPTSPFSPQTPLTPLPASDEMTFGQFQQIMMERVAGGGRVVRGEQCDAAALLKAMYLEAFGEAGMADILKAGEAFEEQQLAGARERQEAARRASQARDDARDANRRADMRDLEKAEMRHYLDNHIDETERRNFFQMINSKESTPFPSLCDQLIHEDDGAAAAGTGSQQTSPQVPPAASPHAGAAAGAPGAQRLSLHAVGAVVMVAASPMFKNKKGGGDAEGSATADTLVVQGQALLTPEQAEALRRLEEQRETVEDELDRARASANLMTGMLVEKNLGNRLRAIAKKIQAYEDIRVGNAALAGKSGKGKKMMELAQQLREQEKAKAGGGPGGASVTTSRSASPAGSPGWGGLLGAAAVKRRATARTDASADAAETSPANAPLDPPPDASQLASRKRTGRHVHFKIDVCFYGEDGAVERSDLNTQRPQARMSSPVQGGRRGVRVASLLKRGGDTTPLHSPSGTEADDDEQAFPPPARRSRSRSRSLSDSGSSGVAEAYEAMDDFYMESEAGTDDVRSRRSGRDAVEFPGGFAVLGSHEDGGGVMSRIAHALSDPNDPEYGTMSSAGMFRGIDSSVDPNSTFGGTSTLPRPVLVLDGSASLDSDSQRELSAAATPTHEGLCRDSSASINATGGGVDASADPAHPGAMPPRARRRAPARGHPAPPTHEGDPVGEPQSPRSRDEDRGARPGVPSGKVKKRVSISLEEHVREASGGEGGSDTDGEYDGEETEESDDVEGAPPDAAAGKRRRRGKKKKKRTRGSSDAAPPQRRGSKERSPLYPEGGDGGAPRERGEPRQTMHRRPSGPVLDDAEPVWLEPPPLDKVRQAAARRHGGKHGRRDSDSEPATPIQYVEYRPGDSPADGTPTGDPRVAKPTYLPSLPPSQTLSPFTAGAHAVVGGRSAAVAGPDPKRLNLIDPLPRVVQKPADDDARIDYLLNHAAAYEPALTAVARAPNLDKLALKNQALAMSALKAFDRNRPYLYKEKCETRRTAVPQAGVRLPGLKRVPEVPGIRT